MKIEYENEEAMKKSFFLSICFGVKRKDQKLKLKKPSMIKKGKQKMIRLDKEKKH